MLSLGYNYGLIIFPDGGSNSAIVFHSKIQYNYMSYNFSVEWSCVCIRTGALNPKNGLGSNLFDIKTRCKHTVATHGQFSNALMGRQKSKCAN